MQNRPLFGPDDGPRTREVFAATRAGSAAHLAALRSEIETIVEDVLTHAFGTASRLATETIARAERDSLAPLRELRNCQEITVPVSGAADRAVCDGIESDGAGAGG